MSELVASLVSSFSSKHHALLVTEFKSVNRCIAGYFWGLALLGSGPRHMSTAPELWSHGWVLPPTASSSPLCQTNFNFPPTASFRLHDTMLNTSTRIVTHEFFCASLTQTFFLPLQSPYSSHDPFLVVEKKKRVVKLVCDYEQFCAGIFEKTACFS